jgi:hypothetical protein
VPIRIVDLADHLASAGFPAGHPPMGGFPRGSGPGSRGDIRQPLPD